MVVLHCNSVASSSIWSTPYPPPGHAVCPRARPSLFEARPPPPPYGQRHIFLQHHQLVCAQTVVERSWAYLSPHISPASIYSYLTFDCPVGVGTYRIVFLLLRDLRHLFGYRAQLYRFSTLAYHMIMASIAHTTCTHIDAPARATSPHRADMCICHMGTDHRTYAWASPLSPTRRPRLPQHPQPRAGPGGAPRRCQTWAESGRTGPWRIRHPPP